MLLGIFICWQMARAIHASFYQIWQVMCITVPCWCTHSVLRVNLKHDWILLYNTVCAQAITSNREMVEWFNRNRGFRRCIFICIWNKYWIPTIFIKYNKNCSYYMYFDMHTRDYNLFAGEGFGKFEISGGVQTTWLYPALRMLYIFLLYAFPNIFNAHVYQNLLIFFF